MAFRGRWHLSFLFQIEVWLLLATCIVELATMYYSEDGGLLTDNVVSSACSGTFEGRVHDRSAMYEGRRFTAFSACSLRASSKSPLERGGPLAVGSVCSEARFQPCDLFKIEQSLLSSKIAVFSPVSLPYILFATSFPVCRNSHPSLEWAIPLTRGFDQD
jgi:hypothetical protein